MSEYQVAGWLNISRTPAREALQRLEAEGLLSYSPRRGLVVVSVDDDALEELYDAREIIEGTLARLAANNGSGPMLAAILRMSEIEPTLIDDPDRMHQHNREFHELIYRAAHNRYLAKAAAATHDVVAADRRAGLRVDRERHEAILGEHKAMATAIAERRTDDAERATIEHIRAARKWRLAYALGEFRRGS